MVLHMHLVVLIIVAKESLHLLGVGLHLVDGRFR